MHFVFATRGHHDYVRTFIEELATRYLQFDYKGENRILKMRLCPIQLWDSSFPKQHLDAVLNTCLSGAQGKPFLSSAQKYIWALRKAMHLKKIPEYSKENLLAMQSPQHTEVIGIGIKEDEIIKDKDGEYEGI